MCPKYVKRLDDVLLYRLTKPEGHNRKVALLVEKEADGAQKISVGLCIIDPKSLIPYHTHEDEEEVMFFLEGEGIARIEDVDYKVSKGSIVYCPPKMKHQIINSGDQGLKFIFIYGPAGPEQVIKSIGEPIEERLMDP